MQQNIIRMESDIKHYLNENKKLAKTIDVMRRQREEQVNMQQEENRKVIYDTQNSKDKVEKLKVELYDMKKRMKELDKYHELYEDLKLKDSER